MTLFLAVRFHMLIEQAIYTSADTSRGRGYHLVSRSAGITTELAKLLNPWCPSHGSLLQQDENASSLNFHPLDRDHVAVSRTVYGEPEYSQRGGLQVVTLILLLRQEHLQGYAHNPLAVARMARALGHLRWRRTSPALLPRIELPDKSNSEKVAPYSTQTFPAVDEAVRLLRLHEQVAIIPNLDRLSAIEAILLKLPPTERHELSFTSGLKPSRQRPFRLHMLARGDTLTQIKLATLHVHCLSTG